MQRMSYLESMSDHHPNQSTRHIHTHTPEARTNHSANSANNIRRVKRKKSVGQQEEINI